MISYVQETINQWGDSVDPKRRKMLYTIERGTLPNKTIQRIVKCFGLPVALQEVGMHFGECFNLPDLISDSTFRGIDPPNKTGVEVFQKEFELTEAIYKSFKLILSNKPPSQDIKRRLKQTKVEIKASLQNIKCSLDVHEKYSRALILSALGKGISDLEKNLDRLIEDVTASKIIQYRADNLGNQLRDGAILSLSYSYYYCFEEEPKLSTSSTFFKYLNKLFEQYDFETQPSDDALLASMKKARKTLLKNLNK